MNDGYIKLYRKILNNPIVCKDSDYIAVWVYILLSATHKEYDVIFKGKRITLLPGQLLTGRISISKKLKINSSKIDRILKTFKNEQQIEQQTSNKNRLITILNWNEYQQNEQQIEQQVNNNRTTSEQQLNTNKNVKNDKNIKKYIYEQMFEEFWQRYPKKKNKSKAQEWYLKNKPTEELHKEIMMSILFCKDDEQWQKDNGQFIPYPSTFLNQKRWEDFRK